MNGDASPPRNSPQRDMPRSLYLLLNALRTATPLSRQNSPHPRSSGQVVAPVWLVMKPIYMADREGPHAGSAQCAFRRMTAPREANCLGEE